MTPTQQTGQPTDAIALERIHGPVADSLAEAVRTFDSELECDLPFVRELCARVARYRGKMLRPTLLLLSAQATGRIRREHVVLAAVLEMVHVATLVHDDVLDDADLRRNAPTINAAGDNEAAVLLGDYLISHAYHLCSSIENQQASRRVAAATNRVCLGELMQVHHRGDWSMSEATYFEIIRRKTAELTRAACELGARYAGADETTIAALADFGEDLGIAFQIVDDLLDITATQPEMGKTLGRDIDLAKPTLPLIHALRSAGDHDRTRLQSILMSRAAHAAPSGASATDLRELLKSTASLDYAAAAARRHVDSARSRLRALPPGDAATALQTAAGFILQRRR